MVGVPGHITNKDQDIIENYRLGFEKKTDEEMINEYYKQCKCGITGVRMQMLYLIGLRKAMIERFGKSPIEFDGVVLEL
jgi:hypothetical protein